MARRDHRSRAKKDFQAIADAYMADHPNVKINITSIENEAFKAKLQTSLQRDDIPDLFQSWGGGAHAASRPTPACSRTSRRRSRRGRTTINPGALSIYNYNGKQYGVPWDLGIVGIWYNKDLFAKAGITAPPDDVGRVPGATSTSSRPPGITPYRARPARTSGRRMHCWAYLASCASAGPRHCSQMVQSGNWNTDVLHAGRGRSPEADRQEAVPEGLPERRP